MLHNICQILGNSLESYKKEEKVLDTKIFSFIEQHTYKKYELVGTLSYAAYQCLTNSFIRFAQSQNLNLRSKSKQAGAEPCQAQQKLEIAKHKEFVCIYSECLKS